MLNPITNGSSSLSAHYICVPVQDFNFFGGNATIVPIMPEEYYDKCVINAAVAFPNCESATSGKTYGGQWDDSCNNYM
jgi:hypothetical protein